MKYVCDAPAGKTWFALETEAEAEAESALMGHAVHRHFREARDRAAATYNPPAGAPSFERDIGLKGHIARAMPVFLTLRDGEGAGLATAMLPPPGRSDLQMHAIIVGPGNGDPFVDHAPAIEALAKHFNYKLSRELCYPYRG